MSKEKQDYVAFDIVGDATDTRRLLSEAGKIPVGIVSFVIHSTQEKMDDLKTPFSTRDLANITDVATCYAGVGASDQVAVPYIVQHLMSKHRELFDSAVELFTKMHPELLGGREAEEVSATKH